MAENSRKAPIVALLLLGPLLGEVVFGALRFSAIFVLPMLMGFWGCGALLIRYVARKRDLGWGSIFLLGLALALAEECIVQQTSLAPLVGVDPKNVYSRWAGVNWVYLLWALGFESIWIILLPIQLTELMYPKQKDDAWIGPQGLAIALAAFAIASLGAWYSWTQVFMPKFFPASVYHPPLRAFATAGLLIAGLIFAALKLPHAGKHSAPGASAPEVAGISFLLSTLWCGLVLVAYGVFPKLPWALALALGLGLAALSLKLIQDWTQQASWDDRHKASLIFGAYAGSALAGFGMFWFSGVKPLSLDFIGKLAIDLIALAFLGWMIRKRLKASSFQH